MKRSVAKKLYYSIGEVSELTQLQPYTLRAWEKEFGCLRPRRIHGKNRAYRERDIGIILLIKRLLYKERYSMKGVRQKLKNEPALLQVSDSGKEWLERFLRGEASVGDPAQASGRRAPGATATNEGGEGGWWWERQQHPSSSYQALQFELPSIIQYMLSILHRQYFLIQRGYLFRYVLHEQSTL